MEYAVETEPDLSSAKLIRVQQCSRGGYGEDPVIFEVKYYQLADGTVTLVTKPEHKKYLDQMLAMSKK
jgi:hypothetical protein